MRYSAKVHTEQSLPLIWLLSDARNDAGLEAALAKLPEGSGFVFRHYHLKDDERADRFNTLAEIARKHGHVVVFARDSDLARSLGADGVYGPLEDLAEARTLLRLATAHDEEELQAAIDAGVEGIFLSPVFPTASHPGAETLGVYGFNALAQRSPVPVIALGGMNYARAWELDWPRWGAIDGLASTNTP